MTSSSDGVLPLLAPGDVYIYAHGNGAVFVMASDRKSRLAPLPDAIAVATGCHEAGRRVVIGADAGDLATEVVRQIRAAGVPAEDFVPTKPPYRWGEETDALMEAATVGSDHILDDLLDRGADVGRTDVSGSTALHHAAANGNLRAVDALIAAGADPGMKNNWDATPRMLAIAAGETEAASRLGALMGIASHVPRGEVHFRRSHFAAVYLWFVPLVVPAIVAAFLLPQNPVAVVACFGALVALWASVIPRSAFWAGGVPRSCGGTDLRLRAVTGRSRTVDLTSTSYAGVGSVDQRTRYQRAIWLLLAHPEGAPVNRRALRRLEPPADELDGLLEGGDHYVVVPIAGEDCDEVLAAVGAVLQHQGTPMSPRLRALVARAQDSPGRY